MWENKQSVLSQGLNLQMFLRDAKQAEVMLSQQVNSRACAAKAHLPQQTCGSLIARQVQKALDVGTPILIAMA